MAGFSLIELMVASSIGLIMTVLVIDYFASSLQSKQANGAYNTMKDAGALALYYIARNSRDAGINTIPIYGDSSIANGGCTPDQDFCSRDTNEAFDRVAVRKIFPDHVDACNGIYLEAGDEVVEVVSVQLIDNVNTLVCQSYSLATNSWHGSADYRVLQGHIDSFQVRYFQRGQPLPVPGVAVTDWDAIEGMEIALVINSQVRAFNSNRARSFKIFESETLNFNDQFARQIFQTTIAFNNQLL